MLSNVAIAEKIYEVVGKTQPRNILDLGIGNGLWGAFIRNYYGASKTGCVHPLSDLVIHGIELYPKYRNPMWELYNQVLIGDVSKYLHMIHEYDLVLGIGILEHLDKSIGLQILRKAKKVLCGVTKIDIPANWTEDEFTRLGFEVSTLNPSFLAAWQPLL